MGAICCTRLDRKGRKGTERGRKHNSQNKGIKSTKQKGKNLIVLTLIVNHSHNFFCSDPYTDSNKYREIHKQTCDITQIPSAISVTVPLS